MYPKTLFYHSLFQVNVCLYTIVWEMYTLAKTVINSLDFVANRFFVKLFKSNDINIVKDCQCEFNFNIPSDIVAVHGKNNVFCKHLTRILVKFYSKLFSFLSTMYTVNKAV